MRGGRGVASFASVPCDTAIYWFIIVLPVPFVLYAMLGPLTTAVNDDTAERAKEGQRARNVINWDLQDGIMAPFVSFMSGAVSGVSGISGTLFQAPLLVEMGVTPASIAPTLNAVLVVVSAAVTLQYVVFDSLRWDYAIWFATINFFATFVGAVGTAKEPRSCARRCPLTHVCWQYVLYDFAAAHGGRSYLVLGLGETQRSAAGDGALTAVPLRTHRRLPVCVDCTHGCARVHGDARVLTFASAGIVTAYQVYVKQKWGVFMGLNPVCQ